MEYLEFKFTVSPLEPWKDVLEAELGAVGFESFIDTEDGVLAYIQTELYDENSFAEISVLGNGLCEINYEKNKVKPHNWNEEWEKNFSPINVDNRCVIRAPFHEKTNAEYEIVIEPKMSFGTGHHETTHLMVSYILDMDVEGKTVMDMGCGTGILALLAAKKGAAKVDAVDIDDWAYENTVENAERNGVAFINAAMGDAGFLKKEKVYDLFIANINRNILINDMSKYAMSIKSGGEILLSGFYVNDIDFLLAETEKYDFELQERREKNSWASLRLKKK
ncbi:MAG: 50S ribosomal protein L11 methyltransferase [Bacteroidota bacterium]